MPPLKPVQRAALILGGLTAAVLLLLLLLQQVLAERIRSEDQRYRSDAMRALLTQTAHNTELPPPPLPLMRQLPHSRLLALYPIYNGDHLTAVLIHAAAQEGYSGAIELLFLYHPTDTDNRQPPLRVLQHRESGGIADFLGDEKRVRQVYDGVSGATLTAAAVRATAAAVGDWVNRCLNWSARRGGTAEHYLVTGC